MDKLDQILQNNKNNEDKKIQDLKNVKPISMRRTTERRIGDVINIDNILYKVKKIAKKELLLHQMSHQEVEAFNKRFEEHKKEEWKKVWEREIASNPKTVYRNTEDMSPSGKNWYCLKHFKEKYGIEPRMYVDVYNVGQDTCVICFPPQTTQIENKEMIDPVDPIDIFSKRKTPFSPQKETLTSTPTKRE